jgi:hypothetical protein
MTDTWCVFAYFLIAISFTYSLYTSFVILVIKEKKNRKSILKIYRDMKKRAVSMTLQLVMVCHHLSSPVISSPPARSTGGLASNALGGGSVLMPY